MLVPLMEADPKSKTRLDPLCNETRTGDAAR
jgi:hypothetical protein